MYRQIFTSPMDPDRDIRMGFSPLTQDASGKWRFRLVWSRFNNFRIFHHESWEPKVPPPPQEIAGPNSWPY